MPTSRRSPHHPAQQNAYLYPLGLGIHHSGVEVHGVEYAFGGHDFDAPGVFATAPRAAPGTLAFREAVRIGTTPLSPAQVQRVVRAMGSEYKGNSYHLLERNCNQFSDDLCRRLTGAPAPAWVNRLAGLAVSLHCLLPAGWVPPLRPPTAPAPGGDERAALLADAAPAAAR